MVISPIVLHLPWKLLQNELFGSCCYFDDPDINIPAAEASGATCVKSAAVTFIVQQSGTRLDKLLLKMCILWQGPSIFNEGLEIVDAFCSFSTESFFLHQCQVIFGSLVAPNHPFKKNSLDLFLNMI